MQPSAFKCHACGGNSAHRNDDGLLQCDYCGSTHGHVQHPYAQRVRKSAPWLLAISLVALGSVVLTALLRDGRSPQPDPLDDLNPLEHQTPSQDPPETAIQQQVENTLQPLGRVNPTLDRADLTVLHSAQGETARGGRYWIVEVQNDTTGALFRPRAVASLFNAAGRRVAEQSGWSLIDVLQPAQRAVVFVFLNQAPDAYSEERLAASAKTSEMLPSNQVRLEVSDFLVQPDNDRFELIGDVHNTSGAVARFIKVVAVGRNAAGQAVAHASGFVTDTQLPADGRSGFSVKAGTFVAGDVAQWELTAVGQGAR